MTSASIQQATAKCQDVQNELDKFFDAVDEVLSWVPGFLSDLIKPIEDGVNQLRQRLQQLWDRINQFIGQHGDPDRLHQVGADWISKIGNVVGDLSGRIGLDKMAVNLDWEGRGAEAYKATVPAQSSGMASVQGLAEQLRSSLDNLGNGIDSFWTSIYIALVAFGVAVAAAVAGAVTVVGMPAAIALLAAGVGTALTLITTATTSLQTLVNTVISEQSTIGQKVHDLGDQWSRANIGAMQAKSDWHVMQ